MTRPPKSRSKLGSGFRPESPAATPSYPLLLNPNAFHPTDEFPLKNPSEKFYLFIFWPGGGETKLTFAESFSVKMYRGQCVNSVPIWRQPASREYRKCPSCKEAWRGDQGGNKRKMIVFLSLKGARYLLIHRVYTLCTQECHQPEPDGRLGQCFPPITAGGICQSPCQLLNSLGMQEGRHGSGLFLSPFEVVAGPQIEAK